MYNIGIDMGGTHTAVGLVQNLELIDLIEFGTNMSEGASCYVEELAINIENLMEKNGIVWEDIFSIGMGVPGSANKENGMIEYANNLGFSNVPFERMISKRLNKPVILDNDANLAAYGEYCLSKSRAKSFLMVTLGTGIGGGMIIDGKIYRGVNFAEGEVGHMTIHYNGIPCNCGRKGCFEAYASTSALMQRAQNRAVEKTESLLYKRSIGQKEELNGRIFFQAIREQDATAMDLLEEYTTYLAEGLTNLINILQPEELVIGGGISSVGDLFLPQTCEKINQMVYSKESKRNTLIRVAQYGNNAGIIGAARLTDIE